MPRKAIGFKVSKLSEPTRLFQIDDMPPKMNMKVEITDDTSGAGKMTIEVFFNSGLNLINTAEVPSRKENEGFILTDENDNTKINATLDGETITFANMYDNSTLNFNIKLAGKAGGTVGGTKAGGSVGGDSYVWE